MKQPKTITIDDVEYIKKEDYELAKPNKDGLEYCIIRTYSAGVFAGWIDTKSKDMCQEVFECRRLWKWYTYFTLSSLAIQGQRKGKEDDNKYSVPVPRQILKEIIEVIPCSKKAKEQIINTANYEE